MTELQYKPIVLTSEVWGWKTIEELINRQVNLTACLNSIAPKYLCVRFPKNTFNTTRSLRNINADLRLPLKSSANRQKCFSFKGARSWNGLSTHAKQTSSIFLPLLSRLVYLQITLKKVYYVIYKFYTLLRLL